MPRVSFIARAITSLCVVATEVRMIRIDGLGHAWTEKEVDTTGVMWQFFKEPSSESIAGFSFRGSRR